MKSLLILGRQPELGLAELESLYGVDKVVNLSSLAAEVDVDPCLLAFDRLGGSQKFCKILTELNSTALNDIESFLIKSVPEHSLRMPPGKMQLGLSFFGFKLKASEINKLAYRIKKAIQQTGRNVRTIPNKDLKLSSAQVIHNHLTGQNGWELVFIKHKNKTVIAQTVKEQDIASYSLRDYGRPKRDTSVGMLPPKLAQIIINLAVGILPEEARQSVCEIPPDDPIPLIALNKSILDPFCGTGVLLQEALLMGYRALGADIDKRMLLYSEENLIWLKQNFKQLNSSGFTLLNGDAERYQWPDFNFVASEVYLGKAYSSPPSPTELSQNIEKCNSIIKQFLINLSEQTKPGLRICLAVPAWQIKPNHFKYLPLIDQIADLGYNHIQFEANSGSNLIYYRPNQIVARQLLVLVRK